MIHFEDELIMSITENVHTWCPESELDRLVPTFDDHAPFPGIEPQSAINKTAMRGRKNPDKHQSNTSLPPCRVCGEPGTGFHYGVTTCGACKGFFRRSLVRKEPYVCINSHLCHVGPSTSRRQSCPKCRYDKCISVGMSKEACKVGRYSLIKKSKDMKEVLEYHHGVFPGSVDATNETQTPASMEGFYHGNSDIDYVNEYGTDGAGADGEHDTKSFSSLRTASHYSSSDGSDHTDHDSSDGYSFPEDSRMGDKSDEFYSMGSCPENNTLSLSPHEFKQECNPLGNSPYTVLEMHPNTGSKRSMMFDSPKSMTPFGTSSLTPLSSESPEADQSLQVINEDIHILRHQNPVSVLHTDTSYGLDLSHYQHHVNVNDREIHYQPPFYPNPRDSNYNHSGKNCAVTINEPSDLSINQLIAQSINSDSWLEPPDNNVYGNGKCHGNMIDTITNKMDDVSVFEQSTSLVVETPKQSATGSDSPYSNSDGHSSDNFRQISTSDQHHFEGFNYTNGDSKNKFKRENSGIIENGMFTKKLRSGENTEPEFAPALRDALSSNNLMSWAESSSDNQSTPIFLMLCSSELAHYPLSLYDSFPFVCYEKEALAPLLKTCFQISDSKINGLVPLSHTKNVISVSDIYSDDPNPPTFVPAKEECDNKSLSRVLSTESPNEAPPDLLEFNTPEMSALLDELLAVHDRYIGSKARHMSDAEIKSAQETFWRICQLQDKIHGEMKFIDDETYFMILDSTGIDVDKRKKILMTYIQPFHDNLVEIVKFFRSVPGFKDLCLEDRITLTRSCFSLYNILSQYRGIDRERDIVVGGENGMACRCSFFYSLFPKWKHIHELALDFAEALQALKLSSEEVIILKAMILTTPHPYYVLKDPHAVTECNKIYSKCLLYSTRKSCGPIAGYSRFCKIERLFKRMNKSRVQMEDFMDHTRDRMTRYVDSNCTPLFKEVFLTKIQRNPEHAIDYST